MKQRSLRTAVLTGMLAVTIIGAALWFGKYTTAAHVVSGAGASTLALATQYDYYSPSYQEPEDDGFSLLSLFITFGLAFIPANIAKSKGRSFGRWYIYGWLLFIVALIHSLLLSPVTVPSTEPASLEEVD